MESGAKGGIKDDVFFGVVRLGDLLERGERRPEHRLATCLEPLDVYVLPVRLEQAWSSGRSCRSARAQNNRRRQYRNGHWVGWLAVSREN